MYILTSGGTAAALYRLIDCCSAELGSCFTASNEGKYEKLRAVTLLASNVLPSNSDEFGKTPKTAQFF
jgi:hypothetical protein